MLLSAAATVATGACGIVQGSKICTDTDLSTPPIRVTVPLAPLNFTAILTADGKPVAGADVIFFIYRVSAGAPPGEVGFNIGSGTTGSDGLARYTRKGGIDGLTHTDDRLSGYEAQYRPLTKVDGVQYCGAKARGELTVG